MKAKAMKTQARRVARAAALAAAVVSSAALGLDASPPTGSQSWYYEIGGAAPVSAPVNPAATSVTLGVGGTLALKYSCGRFNLKASVSNMFSNVASSLQNTLQSAVTGVLGSLPLYIMQRALPGLYELFQTYTFDFKRTFNIALKSCEDYERDILAGKDPYAGWFSLAKAEAWKSEQAAGNDAVTAKKNVENAGGDKGLTWIGGTKAAGAGQVPIQVIRDTTRAGYNIELNRPATATAPPPSGAGAPRLVELFPSPGDAEDFAVRVLGDEIIRTCNGCTSQSTPGHGLAIEIERERGSVATRLGNLISGTSTPTYTELQQISAPGVAMSARVVETLRELPDQERAILAGRLASEVATARIVEKALAIRRLLLTARREPHVQGNKEAQERLDKAIAEIEHEVDNLLYETRVRREISASTASLLIARDERMRAEGLATPSHGRDDPVQLREGGRFQ